MPVQSYIRPYSSAQLPGDLTVTQFIQSVLVGLSGLPGTMVRPKWQAEPPKNPPGIDESWISFGINLGIQNNDPYIATSPTDNTAIVSQRQQALDVGISIYGPLALEIFGIIRDGWHIPQNTQALTAANMGFTSMAPARSIPDLQNGRFYNRVETSVVLQQQVNRTYKVPTILSASGVILAPTSNDIDYSLAWDSENVEN